MRGKLLNPHTFTVEQAESETDSNRSLGLSSDEARRRLETYGKNTLEAGEDVSALKILFENVNNIIVYLLIAAASVAFAMGDTVEGFSVIVAILIAVISGFASEYKAQKSVESLQNMVKTFSKVKRDGKIAEVPSEELVVGDILFLEEGDSVAADARLAESNSLATIESALTGESEAVNKDAGFKGEEDIPLGDRSNMVYTGTAVTRGNAYAIVTGTAMDTEIGNISKLLSESGDNTTPLEEQLNRLGKALILLAGVVALIVTVLGILSGEEIYSMIKIGIILAIAAVPEALPAVSTITLAIGMRTMASHNALVKSLPAVETLGSTTVICTDKTGTLTENQMTVQKIYISGGADYDVEGSGYEPKGRILKDEDLVNLEKDAELEKLIVAGVLSSNASLVEEESQYRVLGDPTEGGIVVLGKKVDVDRERLESSGYSRVVEVPFDSKAKYMATLYRTLTGEKKLYIKGAPDVLTEMARNSPKELERLEKANDSFTEQGMRVLGIGTVENYSGEESESSVKRALAGGIDILGFIGILDPPREDVKQAIDEAQSAGIRVIMITGDHPKTASIIAGHIGMKNTEVVITGREMDEMSDEELAEKIKSTSIFARVSPENKLQIVRALNIAKEVTAMTGDGVNDAPALNGADIGISMGIRGTQVAKDASDMILTDDRFSTIVDAVREGRTIFDNIEKFVYYLFTCNIVEILAVFLTIVIGMPMPVLALQILWMNLVVDVLPAMSLSWEAGEKDIMKRSPRNPEEAIVTRKFLIKVLWNGALIALGSLAVFGYALYAGYDIETSRTMCFSAMAFGQLFHVLNARKKNSLGIGKDFLKNKRLVLAIASSLALQVLAVYLPFFNRVMDTKPLSFYSWWIVALGSILPTLIIQLSKHRENANKTVG